VTRNSVTDAIEEIWEQYCSSLNSGDLESWMSLWTDDASQHRLLNSTQVNHQAARRVSPRISIWYKNTSPLGDTGITL
jgi:hypothetical protein